MYAPVMLSGLPSDLQVWQRYVKTTNTRFQPQIPGEWVAANNVQALRVPLQLNKEDKQGNHKGQHQC